MRVNRKMINSLKTICILFLLFSAATAHGEPPAGEVFDEINLARTNPQRTSLDVQSSTFHGNGLVVKCGDPLEVLLSKAALLSFPGLPH